MSLPRCQICHNRYSLDLVPYILQPCSHGMCQQCINDYIVVRSSTTCPTCRTTILRHSVNYDLKDMCQAPLEGWREEFMTRLSKHPEIHITLDDVIMPAIPLILCRLENDRTGLYKALVTLVRNTPGDEAFRWVDILGFPDAWEADIKIGKLSRHFDFLEKKNADWLLEFL